MNKINLHKIKLEFSTNFPESNLTWVLLSEPDDLAPDVFLAKIGTWLTILNKEKRR
jgi:hypothetical protein